MLAFLTLLALTAIGTGTAGSFFLVISPELGMYIAAGGLVLLLLTFILAFLSGFVGGGRGTSWFALFFGFFAVLAAVAFGVQHFRMPLTDVSTNLVTPPKLLSPAYPFPVEKGREYLDASLQLNRDYDPAQSAKQIVLFPDLAGVKVKAPGADTYARTLKLVQEQLPGWKKMSDDPKTFHAEFTVDQIPFHLLSDVAIDVVYDARMPNDSTVEIRCHSRHPLVDLGLCFATVQDMRTRLGIEMRILEADLQHRAAMAPPPESTSGTATSTATGTNTSTAPATTAPAPAPAPAKPAVPPAATPTPAKPAPAKPSVKNEKKK